MTRPAERERVQRVKLRARSTARDLLRFVRALEARGVELVSLEDEARAALEGLNRDLARALSALEAAERDVARLERDIAATAARLAQVRGRILDDLGRPRRRQVLEAMLAVEVADTDLEVEPIGPPPDDEDLAAARARALERLAALHEAERRRRRAEARSVTPDAAAVALYARLPAPWRAAMAAAAGAPGDPADPESLAARVRAPATLAKVVAALRPDERAALRLLLEAGGVMAAPVLEARFGGAEEDGYDWDREPPTSTIGRLRVRGLCVIGRVADKENPRRRPRAVVVPRDLRWPLTEALARAPAAPPEAHTVLPEVIDAVLEAEDAEDETDAAETQAIAFDRAQPELAGFAAGAAEAVEPDGAAALIYYVERIWAMYEAAFPGRVPRLREHHLEAARQASERDLAAVGVMHERLLERRVLTMVAPQPHLYGFVGGALEDEDLPLDEPGKAVVFHACDTTIRAFEDALGFARSS